MQWIRILLTLTPSGVLVFWLAKFAIDCPVGDEWALAPILEKFYEGSLSFADLWKQHNEHRVVIPKLILLVVAKWSQWNIAYELTLNVALGIGIFLLWLQLLKRAGLQTAWLRVIVSAMVFGLNQSENWFSGWQMQILLNALAVLAGIAVLTGSVTKWLHIVTAALLGVIATFSFASGMAFWPIGWIILWMRRANKIQQFVWIAIMSAVVIGYLQGYSRPAYHPAITESLSHPLLYAQYVLSYLGAPLSAFSRKLAALEFAPAFVGLAGLVILVGCIREIRDERLVPFVAAAAYSVLSALLSASGRAALGPLNALSLRYITISSFLWITNAILLYRIYCSANANRRIPAILLSGILLLTAVNSGYGALYARKQYYFLLPARQELFMLQDDELLRRLHYDPQTLRSHVEMLKRYRLSVFR